MKQITRDSSAYYLIGYNSAQAPTDGKFHEIKVKVKRPGVQVRAGAATGRSTARRWRARPRRRRRRRRSRWKWRSPTPSCGPSRASVVRSWVGMSRGENGKTRVTFVWEPLPKSPGRSPARGAGARVADGGRAGRLAVVPRQGAGRRARVDRARPRRLRRRRRRCQAGRRRACRSTCSPGKIQLRISVEGAASQVLDSETREITVPDLTGAQAAARHARGAARPHGARVPAAADRRRRRADRRPRVQPHRALC